MTHDTAKQSLKDLERRLAEANANECWWTTDEADKWAGAVFGPKATFTDWGELTAAFSSLDAAVSLTERVLPDAWWQLNRLKRLDGPGWYSEAVIGLTDNQERFGVSNASALALCLACVRALISQGEQ